MIIPYYTLFFISLYSILYAACPYETVKRLAFSTQHPDVLYTWYTYSLMHMNIMHLLINIFSWSVYSGYIEYYTQSILYPALIHFFAVFGGIFLQMASTQVSGEQMRIIGASGGIYGMLAGQIGYMVGYWKDLTRFGKTAHLTLLILPLTIDVIMYGVYPNETEAYTVHMGGFLFGIPASLSFGDHGLSRKVRLVSLATLTFMSCLGITACLA